ncbi:MAG: M17 family metallopeptidase [Arenibacterium sp.]
MLLAFADTADTASPLQIIESDVLADWMSNQPEAIGNWIKLNGFTGKLAQTLMVPDLDGQGVMALAGFGNASERARTRYALAGAAQKLPEGTYKIASGLPQQLLETECLGWLLSAYKFDRYRRKQHKKVALIAPDGIDATRVEAIAAAEVMLRDLINTPTSDLGPDKLEEAARELAERHGTSCQSIIGDALLERNFPLIHTVGRASSTPPRLIDFKWGASGPKLTLVGKGVCFDTGGLNLKPRGSMALMKKDMGGAANVLGLADMIMSLNIPVQLRVLIPAVENAVSSNSFRPGDILMSRKGLTVENNNTDAEGRLILADALALAEEDEPDLIISMATLTGAARIALGSDIAPFFTDDEPAAEALAKAARAVDDPVWRLPLHPAYETKIEPGIADLDNAPSGGFAGAITAALFLRRFVSNTRYMHFDIYAWSSFNAPARPKGGCGQGVRALFDALPEMLDL